MSVSLLTSNRTVLLIGDESLYIYKVTSRASVFVDDVPWVTEGFENVVADLLRKECGGKSVLILNDMTDQHFKGGQRLPKVGMGDKNKVLKHKLQAAFQNYPIRGALPVKSLKGQPKQSNLYLFAAVPMSEQISKTMEAVKVALVPIAGFTLLPIESADMVAAFSKKMAPPNGGPARWTVFVGQHRNGALRQVITRDGQLAMTRMTPVEDVEKNPSGWATDVIQEFKATISYLTRFGFAASEGADVVVIGDPKQGELIESRLDIECNFKIFTPSEAARVVGCKIGLQRTAGYADPLHAAWAGRKNKLTLPMQAREIDKIHKPRQAVTALVVLLLLGAAYLGYETSNRYQTYAVAREDLNTQQALLVQAEAEYREEVRNMEELGYNIELIQETIDAYELFERDRTEALDFMKRVGLGLGDAMRLDSITFDRAEEPVNADPYGASIEQLAAPMVESRLTLSFPPTMELERGIREVQSLRNRLSGQFPGYEVDIARQVARPEYTRDLKGVAGQSEQEIAAAEDYVAEIVIKGRVQ